MSKVTCKFCKNKDREYFESRRIEGGLTNTEIAKRMGLSVNHVIKHFKEHVYKKPPDMIAEEKEVAKAEYSNINYLEQLQRLAKITLDEIDDIRKDKSIDVVKRAQLISQKTNDYQKIVDKIDKIFGEARSKEEEDDMVLTKLEIVVIDKDFSHIDLSKYGVDNG